MYGIWGLITMLILGGCSEQAKPSSASGLPHIIFILADDMGYGDISAINKEAKVNTPHLDRIVNEGMYFTDAHSGSAVCTPTRYGVLTGRYCFRTRLKSGVLVGHSPSLIEPGRMTIAQLLSQKGYHSACIGKWHLGLDWQKKDPSQPLFTGSNWDIKSTHNINYQATVRGGAVDHGFDHEYILPASLDIPPYCFISNQHVVGDSLTRVEGIREGRGLFWRPGDATNDFDFTQILPHLTQQATAYITQRHAQSPGSPFFLYFPLTAPHTPWVPTEDFQGSSEAGTYGDFVQQVDHTVGRLLSTLDSLGIADRTLIMFSSDNGSHWMPSDIDSFDHHANYHFSGMKSDAWEGGHRVPLLARWPDYIPSQSTSDQMVCLTDLFATFAAITHQSLPYYAAEDSYSFLSALTATEDTLPTRQDIIHHSIDGTFAIRQDQWKLILGRGSGGWSSAGDPSDPPGQLYNLQTDVGETQNVYLQYPQKVAALTQLLDMYRDEQRSRY